MVRSRLAWSRTVRYTLLMFVPLLAAWFLVPEVMHPRTFMVAGTGAGILTLVLYDNLIHDCVWTGRQAGAIRALMTQGVLSAPAWALLSGNDPRTIFIGTAAVTLAVVAALEWIRRNIGEPVPAGYAGRSARRFWRAVRRATHTRG